MRQASPCKDCPDRHIGCHSSCRLYIEWKNAWDEYKANKPDDSITISERNIRVNWENMRYQRRQQRKKYKT